MRHVPLLLAGVAAGALAIAGAVPSAPDDAYSYRYYSLLLPGTQSGYVRCTRFRLYESDVAGTNLAASATVSGPSIGGSETTDKATDDNDAGQWTTNNATDARLVVDFGSAQAVKFFNVRFSTYPTSGNGYKIEGSDDGTTWTTIYDTQAWFNNNAPGWDAPERRVVHANRVYEVQFDGTQSNGFRDIGFFDALDAVDASLFADEANRKGSIDINTAYKTATADAEYWANIGEVDLTQRGTFSITSDDLRIAFRTHNQKITKFSMSRATAGGNAMPSAFTIRVSYNEGASWTVVYTTSGLSWSAGENKTFTLDAHG